ncbi:MAG: exodeoxyribonuclease VII large subunit [Chloroflexi bacterium]|nr:exodeoxyribonuclease VII large subunit [Chloroflexota bacterium]
MRSGRYDVAMRLPFIPLLTVRELTQRVASLLAADELLSDLWVQGEVSNVRLPSSGHLYFSLKDDSTQVRCVLFRSQLRVQSFLPEQGQTINAHGRVSVYEREGVYQLIADSIQPVGLGAWELEFRRVQEKLARDGLFDRKRPLPRFPRVIGVVTSPAGAAVQDIQRVLAERYPLVELVVIPTLVQGDGAPQQIVAALEMASRLAELDVLVVARGGGAIEDLWAFNDERVARAIFASRVPVVTGIGHETDETIADLVSDLRAPTPSAAAMAVTPDRDECLRQVVYLSQQAAGVVQQRLAEHWQRLHGLGSHARQHAPTARLIAARHALSLRRGRAGDLVGHALSLWRKDVERERARAGALDPAAVLTRGFSLCWHVVRGHHVRSVSEVAPGDRLEIQVADGAFSSVALDGRAQSSHG